MEKSEQEEETKVPLEEKGPEDDQLAEEKVSIVSDDQTVGHLDDSAVISTTESEKVETIDSERKNLVDETAGTSVDSGEKEDSQVGGEVLKQDTPASYPKDEDREISKKGEKKEDISQEGKEENISQENTFEEKTSQEEKISQVEEKPSQDDEKKDSQEGKEKIFQEENKEEISQKEEEKELISQEDKKEEISQKEEEKELISQEDKKEEISQKEEKKEISQEDKKEEKKEEISQKEEKKEEISQKEDKKEEISQIEEKKEEISQDKKDEISQKEEKKELISQNEDKKEISQKEEKKEEISQKEESSQKEEKKNLQEEKTISQQEEKKEISQQEEKEISQQEEKEISQQEEKEISQQEEKEISQKEKEEISQEEKNKKKTYHSGKDEKIPPPPELEKSPTTQEEEEESKLMPNSALNIGWSFGFNQNIPVWNLTDDENTKIIYTSSHTGIIYDYISNTQSILQGHANSINCTSLSPDKKWLVTADKGKDSTVIVWNTRTCFPIRTLFDVSPHGMQAVALSPDAKYLATMSAGDKQEFSIWDWTVSEDKPLASVILNSQFSGQNYIFFCEENLSYIVTNSENQVIFYQWKDDTLKYFAPPLTDQDFHIQIGKYSQSLIIADTIHALTGTSVGNLVVWDTHRSMMEGKKRTIANKKASKIIKLVPSGISVLTLQETNIVVGDMSGNVSFFDQRMTLLHCFNQLNLGPIKSLSFSFPKDELPRNQSQSMKSFTLADESISFPNFTISTLTAKCALFKLILRDHGKPIPAIATHPFKPFLATGSHAGFLKLYNYIEKVSIGSCTFEKEMIECCAFSPDGYHLAVGFFSGVIQVLDSFTLKVKPSDIHNYSKQTIIQVVFSQNSCYLAAADSGFTTSLLKKEGSTFIFLGHYRAHYKPIRELMFGEKFDDEEPRLLSLGEDRMLVEYDLGASSVNDVRILSIERIEQSATPRCMAWHPPLNKEHFIVTANDQHKYKLYNSTTMMCRKTTLAPIYECPIAKLIVLSTEGVNPKHMYMAFLTQDKVGLQILPFDGNPHQSTALIAHPGGVHNLVASYDGTFLFTTSSQEPSIHMWQINASALEAQLHLGGEDLIPFYQLIDGGREGPFFEELKEYFYFCQLRSSNINSMATREVTSVIPVKEIPFLMRALGFYPSEQELADMVNEVKYSEYVDKGEFKEEIDLPDFLKLYINHRPYRNLTGEKLRWAFDVLGMSEGESEGESCLLTNDMLSLIQSQGEHITNEELDEILMDLCLLDLDCSNELGNCKDGGQIKDFSHLATFIDCKLPEVMTASTFASNLLALPENIFKT